MLSFIPGEKLSLHPRYKDQRTMRDFWHRSDRARHDYAAGQDAQGKLILPKHEREPADRYERRKLQAIVRRYTRPIIDRYNDFVTREEAKRPEAPDGSPYETILEDADGAGTPLPVFMKRALRKAQVDGISYVLVDASVAGVFRTAAEEIAAGNRPVLRRIEADDVVWWRYWQGALVEALILFEDEDGDPFAWYVTPKFTQKIWIKKGAEGNSAPLANQTRVGNDPVVMSADAPTPHTYGGCPLVALRPIFDDDKDVGDDSQAAPLSEGQKRVCNIDSWLIEELQSATFTTTVFLGVSADQVKDIAIGPGQGLALPGTGTTAPSIGKIGSDTTQADSLRAQLDYEIRELYRTAGLTSGNPTEVAQPESGVAKAFAFNEIAAKLAALSDAAEAAENTAILRMSQGFGFAFPGKADWPDEFETPDLAEELGISLQMQTADLPPVLQRAQTERIASVAFKLTDDQRAELKKQLDAKASAAARPQTNPVINPALRTPGI